jgi:hypothetical protein
MIIKLRAEAVDDHGTPYSLGLVEGGSGLEAFVFVLEGAVNTYWQKERLYGGAWRKQGWMGNLARIMSKTARLKNMLWRDDALESSDEPIQDTVQDLINLCVFTLLNRGQQNKWGN